MEKIMDTVVPLRADIGVYPLAATARMSGVGPRTLGRLREAGLLSPAGQGEEPLFSANDIRWLGCLRTMIVAKKFSIPGIKKMLGLMPCWEAADCPARVHCCCPVRGDRSEPTMLRLHRQMAEPREERPASASAGLRRCK